MLTSLISLLLVMQLGFGLEDGTPVKLRLARTISSADAKVNENVDFEVLEEIKVEDVIVIPRGALALATVTEAEPKKRMGRAGKLNVNIDTVRLSSGEKVALRAVKEVKGGGNQGKMTGAIVATSLIFWPAAPLFLLVHGKDISIPKGTEITAYINGNIALDPSKFGVKTASNHAQPASSSTPIPLPIPIVAGASTELSTIDLKSTPDGAEITIDGKFVGSTPSLIKLAPGDHKVSVEKPGFKQWQRTMTVSPNGNQSVNVTLESGMIILTAQQSKDLPASQPSMEPGSKAYADCGTSLNMVPVSSSNTGLKSLACGEEVTVVSHDRNWTRIKSEAGKGGSVQSKFISEKKPQ